MKINNQKGFILPLVIGIIAVLIFGGGVYVYKKDSNCSGLDDMARALCLANNKEETLGIDFGNRPDLKQEIVSTTDVTKDWKTYTNTQYGFSFKHPTSVSIQDYPKLKIPGDGPIVGVGVININDEINHTFSGVNIVSNENKLSLEQWAKVAFVGNISKIYSQEIINGETVLKLETSNGSALQYAFAGSDFVVVFYRYKSEKYPDRFNQILSTFKFTN